MAPGQLGSLSFLPLAQGSAAEMTYPSLQCQTEPCGGSDCPKAAGGQQQLLFQLAAAPSIGNLGPVLRMQWACCYPCSMQELIISLSDPVKLHGQVRNGSSLYQKGEIGACEQLADWVID